MSEWGERITGPYESQGKCDYCDAPPGFLVNGLTPCACSTGTGASVDACSCPWGYAEGKRRRQRESQTGETPRPPVSSRTETGEKPSSDRGSGE